MKIKDVDDAISKNKESLLVGLDRVHYILNGSVERLGEFHRLIKASKTTKEQYESHMNVVTPMMELIHFVEGTIKKLNEGE